MGVGLGDHVVPSHGAEDGSQHQESFTIVGILADSGTPHDRAVFVKGFRVNASGDPVTIDPLPE